MESFLDCSSLVSILGLLSGYQSSFECVHGTLITDLRPLMLLLKDTKFFVLCGEFCLVFGECFVGGVEVGNRSGSHSLTIKWERPVMYVEQ